MMALKWLFHFKIFDLVPEEPIEYDKLAASANVPVLELKRMLRLAMTSYIFTEHEEEMVQHNTMSRAFAHDENMRRGIPFFCDVIMPAAAKMVDATTRWPGSEDSDKTACNIAQSSDLTFPEYMTQSNQTEGYTCLMNLLAGQTFQQNVYSANVVQGFDWASLPRDSLVVDVRIRLCDLDDLPLIPTLIGRIV
jgi:6-hydroxytryprostatin B O-methyltransferase